MRGRESEKQREREAIARKLQRNLQMADRVLGRTASDHSTMGLKSI